MYICIYTYVYNDYHDVLYMIIFMCTVYMFIMQWHYDLFNFSTKQTPFHVQGEEALHGLFRIWPSLGLFPWHSLLAGGLYLWHLSSGTMLAARWPTSGTISLLTTWSSRESVEVPLGSGNELQAQNLNRPGTKIAYSKDEKHVLDWDALHWELSDIRELKSLAR